LQDDLTGLTARVLTLEEAETVTPTAFSSHVEATGNGSHLPQFGLTNTHIAEGAAIAPSKLDLPSLYDVLNIAAMTTESEVVALFAPHISSYGVGGHIPMNGLTNSHIAEGAAIAPSKLDMAALEAELNIQSGSVVISDLLYTVTQSSVFDAPGTVCEGTWEKLNDDVLSSGAGTLKTGSGIEQWIKVDLGSVRSVINIMVAGGILDGGFSTISGALQGAWVQLSNDDVNWNLVHIIPSVVNTPLGNISGKPTPIVIPLGLACRYIRLLKTSGGVATSEFRVRGW
jgi:hypothetical protein